MVEPFELYDVTALDWIRDGDEVRVEVDEAVVRELVVTRSVHRDST